MKIANYPIKLVKKPMLSAIIPLVVLKRGKQKMQPEWFEDFAKQILDEKGVNVPDEEVKQQLVKDISVRARDVVLARLLDDMNDEELKQMELAMNEEDQQAADRIVAAHQEVINNSLLEFKRLYLKSA